MKKYALAGFILAVLFVAGLVLFAGPQAKVRYVSIKASENL